MGRSFVDETLADIVMNLADIVMNRRFRRDDLGERGFFGATLAAVSK